MANVNIFRVGLFTILIVVPLLPKFPLQSVTGTYVAVRAEDFLIAFFGIFWLLRLFKMDNLRSFFSDNLNLAIFFYLLVGLASFVSSLVITFSVTPHVALLHYLRRIEYFLPLFIASLAVRDRKDMISVYGVILGVAVLVLFYALGQIYFGLPVISTTNEEYAKGLLLPFSAGARVNSTFGGHYDLAAYLAIVLTLAAAFLLSRSWRGQSLRVNGLVLAISIALYWLLVATESRVSFVALIGGVVAVLVVLKRFKLIVPVIGALIILGGILSPNLAKRLILTAEFTINFVEQKLQSDLLPIFLSPTFAQMTKPVLIPQDAPIATPTAPQEPVTAETEKPAPGEPANLFERIVYRSSGIRFNVEWPRAIRAFLKNPIYGTGFASITLATDNDYLRALGETGLLGVAGWFLIFWALFKQLRLFLKKAHWFLHYAFGVGMVGVVVVMLINAVFIDVFEASKVAMFFWTLVGILTAVAKFEVKKG